MNQILKDTVYNKGTRKQVNFLAEIGGMNDEEKEIFNLIHAGKTDAYIQDSMNLTRRTYERIEESIRAKLLLAIFECINCHMEDND